VSRADIWKWSRQLISALYTCHEQQMVTHLDIKPENLVLDQNNNLIVVDFGQSKVFENDDDDLTGKRFGTD
jgi:serine/threonine protein kinase